MFEACQLRSHAETDAGAPHFGQGDGPAAAAGLVALVGARVGIGP
jgi:hypothetical protein